MSQAPYRQLLDSYPRTASLDYDGAIRRVLADALAASPNLPAMGVVFDGYAPPPAGSVIVHPEWADGHVQAGEMGIVLLDAEGTLGTASNTAHVDETTLWPDEDEAPGAQVGLRVYARYQVEIPIMVEANDRTMRGALVNAVTRTVMGHDAFEAAPNADRYGLALDAGAYYYGLTVRVLPQRLRRLDAAGSSAQRLRRAVIAARCSIDVAYPVALPTIQSTTFAPPTPEELDDGFDPVEV